MRLMPIYQKPNTSKTAKDHKIYPYVLRGLRMERPNQVWCADITYSLTFFMPHLEQRILSMAKPTVT